LSSAEESAERNASMRLQTSNCSIQFLGHMSAMTDWRKRSSAQFPGGASSQCFARAGKV
jgi:hypothetical protein